MFNSSVGINDASVTVAPRMGETPAPRSNTAWMHQTGWPLRALEYRHVGAIAVGFPDDPTGWRPPLWLARFKYYPKSLPGPQRPPVPLRPIPLGLAVDSALYGGLLFAAFAMLGPGRRALRRWRGLCPACAYSRAGLAADAVCPECGRAA